MQTLVNNPNQSQKTRNIFISKFNRSKLQDLILSYTKNKTTMTNASVAAQPSSVSRCFCRFRSGSASEAKGGDHNLAKPADPCGCGYLVDPQIQHMKQSRQAIVYLVYVICVILCMRTLLAYIYIYPYRWIG